MLVVERVGSDVDGVKRDGVDGDGVYEASAVVRSEDCRYREICRRR